MIINFIKVEWRESSTNEQLPPNPTHKVFCDGGPYSLGPKSLWLMINWWGSLMKTQSSQYKNHPLLQSVCKISIYEHSFILSGLDILKENFQIRL